LLTSSEKWLARVKRHFSVCLSNRDPFFLIFIFIFIQNDALKPGLPLNKLRAFYAEGISIPVDFDQYLLPIASAIGAADAWLTAHSHHLVALGITVSVTHTSNDEKAPSTADTQLGSVEKLQHLYDESTQLIADVEEAKYTHYCF
jgi:hypothetical protein